jgi:hypothetical protein
VFKSGEIKMAKITNIKATPAPLDLVSSAPQSTPLKELEAIATRFVEIIRKRSAQRGEKVAITVPEILMGEGRARRAGHGLL